MIMRTVGVALCILATAVPAMPVPALSAPTLSAEKNFEPDLARQKALLYLLRQDCGSCHGMTLKGGLGLPLLPESLAGKDAAALADIIRNGVSGTPMPPWGFEISPDEALWLVRTMKEGLQDD